jgi:hypothetical protein
MKFHRDPRPEFLFVKLALILMLHILPITLYDYYSSSILFIYRHINSHYEDQRTITRDGTTCSAEASDEY